MLTRSNNILEGLQTDVFNFLILGISDDVHKNLQHLRTYVVHIVHLSCVVSERCSSLLNNCKAVVVLLHKFKQEVP